MRLRLTLLISALLGISRITTSIVLVKCPIWNCEVMYFADDAMKMLRHGRLSSGYSGYLCFQSMIRDIKEEGVQ